MYEHMHMYVICFYVHSCIDTYTSMYASMYVKTQIYTYLLRYICAYICVLIYACMHKHTLIYVCLYTYVKVYIDIAYMHTSESHDADCWASCITLPKMSCHISFHLS